MEKIPYKPRKHILVCTNERTEGKACCFNVKGMDIYRELKDFVRLNGFASLVWVTKTGCLGFCNNIGTTVVIYPDGLWFKEVTIEDLDSIKRIMIAQKPQVFEA